MSTTRRTRSAATPRIKGEFDKVLESPRGLWHTGRVMAAKTLYPTAPALHALQPVFTDAVETMGVDRWFRCYISEDFVMYMKTLADAVSLSNPCPTCGSVSHHPLAYIAGVIIHESQHCLRKHSKRAEALNVPMVQKARHQFNIAGDLAINDDLLETLGMIASTDGPRLCLPHFAALECVDPWGAFLDSSMTYSWVTNATMHFATKDVEDIEGIQPKHRVTLTSPTECSFTATYDGAKLTCEGDVTGVFTPGDTVKVAGHSLVFKAKECLQPKLYCGPGFDTVAKFPNDWPVEYYYNEWSKLTSERERLNVPQVGPFLSEGDPTDCGSGAHGGEEDHELGAPTSESPGLSETEVDIVRRDVADRIKDAAAQRGNMAKGMQMWADEVLTKSVVSWQKLLAKAVRTASAYRQGHDVRTFRRLGRASASTGYRLTYPSTHTPLPRVGVVLDTSGSMGYGKGSLLSEAMAEVEGICKQLGAEVVFIAVDSGAGEVQEIKSFKEACLTGGGGTDMRVGIAAMEKLRNPVSTCVVLTDGDTPWPTKKSNNINLVAGIVGNSSSYTRIPPFIKVVKIGQDQ